MMPSVPELQEMPELKSGEFHPAILRMSRDPPSPLPQVVLRVLLVFLAVILIWAAVGRVDMVAVAPGRLVPEGYVKIVQPAEPGVVKAILVSEGERVVAGQDLIHLDSSLSDAERSALLAEFHSADLASRRAEAELTESTLERMADDPSGPFKEAVAQMAANERAYRDAIALEERVQAAARSDLSAATEIHDKIRDTLGYYVGEQKAFAELASRGHVGKLALLEKERAVIEHEQDLRTQKHNIHRAEEEIAQSEKRLAQLASDRRRQLFAEKMATTPRLERARQELAKIDHRQRQLSLKAPQPGVIQDLATHTIGTVVSPGTVLMTLVPETGRLHAEVWISNRDVGFIKVGQPVRVKIDTYEFQKYGLLNGRIDYLAADSARSDLDSQESAEPVSQNLSYKALIGLDSSELTSAGVNLLLAAGMQVRAEILLGNRSVLEYVLSPITKATREAGQER